jgi:hypothetical protein
MTEQVAVPTASTAETTDDGVGARRGGYYYAHGAVATDPNFSKPQKMTLEEAAAIELQNEGGNKSEMSKWNAKDYHWEEKDKTEWAKERLNTLLGTVQVNIGKKGSVNVDEVQVEGFLCVNVRKGKLITLFELTLTVKWTGRMEGDKRHGPTVVKGTISTRELNHEDASATKEGEKKTEDLGQIWLNKKAQCQVVEEEEETTAGAGLLVKDQTAVDRILRQQMILQKTFTKKCMPLLRVRLTDFLTEVRV